MVTGSKSSSPILMILMISFLRSNMLIMLKNHGASSRWLFCWRCVRNGRCHFNTLHIQVNGSYSSLRMRQLVISRRLQGAKEGTWSVAFGKRHEQQVIYEHEPKFCTKCKEIGHTTQGCTNEKPAADRQPFKLRVRKPVAQNQPIRQTLKAPEPVRGANDTQQAQPVKEKEPVETIEEAQVQPLKEKQPVQTDSESQPFTEVRGRRPRKRITPVTITEDTEGHAAPSTTTEKGTQDNPVKGTVKTQNKKDKGRDSTLPKST
ncbi:hypothetical protein DH2020_044732 [Rehmannia glutinosa]|uniref:Uncharacterized protein n=1 Tax=Rehmannia glutinosa TaxID=99300 RepID=A0ABR0UHP0_REHGL